MRIGLTLRGQNELVRALDGWGHDAADLHAPLTNLYHQLIVPAIRARFAQSGPGWAPLSPAYAAYKAIRWPGQPLLVASGTMRTAITGGVGSAVTVTATSLKLDPSQAVPYWQFHEGGTARMPARKMLNFDAATRVRFGSHIEHYLAERAAIYGLKGGA